MSEQTTVDYSTPPVPTGWTLDDADNELAIKFALMAARYFKSDDEPGHLLIVRVHMDPPVTTVAATGVAKELLDDFLKTVPPMKEPSA